MKKLHGWVRHFLNRYVVFIRCAPEATGNVIFGVSKKIKKKERTRKRRNNERKRTREKEKRIEKGWKLREEPYWAVMGKAIKLFSCNLQAATIFLVSSSSPFFSYTRLPPPQLHMPSVLSLRPLFWSFGYPSDDSLGVE